MLPQEFELYGRRFKWFEEDAPARLAEPCIPLLRIGRPLPPDAVVWHGRGEQDKPWFGRCGAGFVYRFENIGEFLLPADGSYVQAYLHPQAEPWAVEFTLCRGVIPRLLHLRGVTCLHAGAVAVGDRVVAFCGPSGAGKSTLTAALATRGHRVVTDDVLPLRASSSGGAIVAGPGLPEVRVYPAAAERIGIADRVSPPGPGQTKAIWRPEPCVTAALPLGAIYLLEPQRPGGMACGAVPVTPREALLTLLFQSFWLDPGATGALASDMTCLGQVVRCLPVSRLSFELGEAGFDFVDSLISRVPVCSPLVGSALVCP